jgi:hypothetical protein
MKSITNKLIKEKREYQKVKTRLKKYYKQRKRSRTQTHYQDNKSKNPLAIEDADI